MIVFFPKHYFRGNFTVVIINLSSNLSNASDAPSVIVILKEGGKLRSSPTLPSTS